MWLYVAEIMTTKGAGIAYGINWIFVIGFALFSLLIFERYNPQKLYLICCIFCSVGIFFIMHYIKETKGLTPYQ